MKQDAVSQICEKILTIIDKEIAKKDGFKVGLENFADECKSPNLKLRLHIVHERMQSSQIVSDCLSPNDIVRIHEVIARDCEARQVKYE